MRRGSTRLVHRRHPPPQILDVIPHLRAVVALPDATLGAPTVTVESDSDGGTLFTEIVADAVVIAAPAIVAPSERAEPAVVAVNNAV